MNGRRGAGLLALAFVVATAIAVVLVVFNRGQEITVGVGAFAWRVEAIYAIYAAALVGLVLMFLVGLPSDLASRRERRRLEARVRELVREGEERRTRQAAPTEESTYEPPVLGGSRDSPSSSE